MYLDMVGRSWDYGKGLDQNLKDVENKAKKGELLALLNNFF